MTHPEEKPEAKLFHFLCHRQGHFDTDMEAWLRQIAADDARAVLIEAEAGQLPPMLQLPLHWAGQTLKGEIMKRPGFAKQFLEHAGPVHDSLRFRYLRALGC